jgi:hypothetical protein
MGNVVSHPVFLASIGSTRFPELEKLYAEPKRFFRMMISLILRSLGHVNFHDDIYFAYQVENGCVVVFIITISDPEIKDRFIDGRLPELRVLPTNVTSRFMLDVSIDKLTIQRAFYLPRCEECHVTPTFSKCFLEVFEFLSAMWHDETTKNCFDVDELMSIFTELGGMRSLIMVRQNMMACFETRNETTHNIKGWKFIVKDGFVYVVHQFFEGAKIDVIDGKLVRTRGIPQQFDVGIECQCVVVKKFTIDEFMSYETNVGFEFGDTCISGVIHDWVSYDMIA